MDYQRQGHSIFRNQPSYTYFNKSFEHPRDTFFLSLNEIDSFFLQPKQVEDKKAFQTYSLNDPRTKQAVTQTYYDHTQPIATKIFYSPQQSCLNVAQHSIGVRIVKARQEGLTLEEDDFLIWHQMEGRRQKESQEFQKFVYDFSQTHKEQIYMPARNLMELYKMWYERKTKVLLGKYPSESYNTHLGLPHLRVCKEVLKEPWAEIVDVTVVAEMGCKPSSSINKQIDFEPMHRSLTSFMEEYINSEDIKEHLEEEAKSEFAKRVNDEDTDIPQYYIPLESLLFLLTAGEYIDLPLEMLIDIKEQENSEEKFIIMDLPLPSRHMGWHTFKQVTEQAAVAFLSMPQIQEENVITATPQSSINYRVQTLEDFMKTYSQNPPKNCTFYQTLFKWQLKAQGKEIVKQIFTLTSTPPQNLNPFSIKLEHKPQFGCEKMSKYELLQEWFKLQLQKQNKSTCYRLDINNYRTLLQESQDIHRLELKLSTTYHIQMPQLLSNLYEFLTLLTTMPCGHYMLRYNPKFKDKLMLCKPSEEITQNTVHLHQLLATEPSELLFMSQQNYLPIADDLCSAMHMEHKILPCTFRPSTKTARKVPKTFTPFNDKELIITRYQNKKNMKRKNAQAHLKSKKKKAQRARKAQRKVNQKPNEEQEQKELQREMEIDQEIYGC